VQSEQEVDDIEAEWIDRYGPVPERAAALLTVARLRAECVRTGIREITVTTGSGGAGGFGGPKYLARISPVTLPTSKTIRLDRLYKGAIYKNEVGQLQLPIKRADTAAGTILDALRDLLPAEPAAETA